MIKISTRQERYFEVKYEQYQKIFREWHEDLRNNQELAQAENELYPLFARFVLKQTPESICLHCVVLGMKI